MARRDGLFGAKWNVEWPINRVQEGYMRESYRAATVPEESGGVAERSANDRSLALAEF
ncbi:Acyl-CoA desaturase [Venturia inaequalis]|nr:Acyl-CoA desaturase [Venturia inaequalis]